MVEGGLKVRFCFARIESSEHGPPSRFFLGAERMTKCDHSLANCEDASTDALDLVSYRNMNENYVAREFGG